MINLYYILAKLPNEYCLVSQITTKLPNLNPYITLNFPSIINSQADYINDNKVHVVKLKQSGLNKLQNFNQNTIPTQQDLNFDNEVDLIFENYDNAKHFHWSPQFQYKILTEITGTFYDVSNAEKHNTILIKNISNYTEVVPNLTLNKANPNDANDVDDVINFVNNEWIYVQKSKQTILELDRASKIKLAEAQIALEKDYKDNICTRSDILLRWQDKIMILPETINNDNGIFYKLYNSDKSIEWVFNQKQGVTNVDITDVVVFTALMSTSKKSNKEIDSIKIKSSLENAYKIEIAYSKAVKEYEEILAILKRNDSVRYARKTQLELMKDDNTKSSQDVQNWIDNNPYKLQDAVIKNKVLQNVYYNLLEDASLFFYNSANLQYEIINDNTERAKKYKSKKISETDFPLARLEGNVFGLTGDSRVFCVEDLIATITRKIIDEPNNIFQDAEVGEEFLEVKKKCDENESATDGVANNISIMATGQGINANNNTN